MPLDVVDTLDGEQAAGSDDSLKKLHTERALCRSVCTILSWGGGLGEGMTTACSCASLSRSRIADRVVQKEPSKGVPAKDGGIRSPREGGWDENRFWGVAGCPRMKG